MLQNTKCKDEVCFQQDLIFFSTVVLLVGSTVLDSFNFQPIR